MLQLSNAAAAIASFRSAAATAGIPCIHLQVEGFGLKPYGAQIPVIINALGISSVTDYCWQHCAYTVLCLFSVWFRYREPRPALRPRHVWVSDNGLCELRSGLHQ